MNPQSRCLQRSSYYILEQIMLLQKVNRKVSLSCNEEIDVLAKDVVKAGTEYQLSFLKDGMLYLKKSI